MVAFFQSKTCIVAFRYHGMSGSQHCDLQLLASSYHRFCGGSLFCSVQAFFVWHRLFLYSYSVLPARQHVLAVRCFMITLKRYAHRRIGGAVSCPAARYPFRTKQPCWFKIPAGPYWLLLRRFFPIAISRFGIAAGIIPGGEPAGSRQISLSLFSRPANSDIGIVSQNLWERKDSMWEVLDRWYTKTIKTRGSKTFVPFRQRRLDAKARPFWRKRRLQGET